jgi:serine/threonine protein phosphatase PrpC
MEDAHIACPDLGEEFKKDYADKVAVFGVFDGHGGEWHYFKCIFRYPS